MRALSDSDLYVYAKLLKIPYFKGVYMRNTLPRGPPWKNESAVINLDTAEGHGTHWVCYKKRGDRVYYYDAYGNLRPPLELIQYLGAAVDIFYNYERDQPPHTVICGHLCLDFLTRE